VIDPNQRAPYCDIPLELAKIAKKCLSFEKKERYQTVEALILDLKNYLQGKPEWLFRAALDIHDPKAFAFQENIYLPSTPQSAEWASLWLAKNSLSGSFKISFEFLFKEPASSLGVLFSVPQNNGKYALEEGFLLAFSLKKKPVLELFRGSIRLIQKEVLFKKKNWHAVEIEKIENSIRCFLDGQLVVSYLSYIPFPGARFGLFFKDQAALFADFKIFSASNNLLVSCLALPDAFLAKKDFDTAYLEYKHIAASFPGRTEEREALFRAGITLLEKAKKKKDKELFDKALFEFENLKKGAGAPLEYLGKSIVYAAQHEYEEEAKCLELALRKFKNHPLLPLLKEHLLLRLHESSFGQKEAHLRLMLSSQLVLKEEQQLPDTALLKSSLKKNLPPLTFLLPSEKSFTIDLACRLDKPMALLEMLEKLKNQTAEKNQLNNLILALLFLEKRTLLDALEERLVFPSSEVIKILDGNFSSAYIFNAKEPDLSLANLLFLLHRAFQFGKSTFILQTLDHLKNRSFTEAPAKELKAYEIWALLWEKQLKKAEALFKLFSEEERASEKSPLFLPYGIYLEMIQESRIAKMHFTAILETAYPSLGALFGVFVYQSLKHPPELLPYEKSELAALFKIYSQLTGKLPAAF
jgi:serine/threonine-protein kinase